MGAIDVDLLEYAHWARSSRGLAENTIRVRMDLLQRLHVCANQPLRTLEPGHLLRFERLAIAGKAAESRRAYVSHLRAFYAWCKQRGYISDDPTALLTTPVIPRRLPRPIDEDNLARALSVARPKMAAILVLASYAGLRACEIAGLDWSDLRRDEGGAFLHVRHGKGSKERVVEVGETVLRTLQAYGIKRRGAMFIGQDGARMTGRTVSGSANRFLSNHDCDATLHQLRHRYGTMAYQLSRDLRMVQEQLGHASPQTTAGYARPSAEAAARMVAALDALALPQPRPSLSPAAGVPPSR